MCYGQGLWTHALGFGDFYYELGVQIVEACLASRAADGGLLELGVLTRAVNRRRGGQVDPVTSDDVGVGVCCGAVQVRAIKALKCLGGGFTLVAIGTLQYVRSVPGELNLDKNKVLELAQNKGYVSQGQITAALGWTRRRCTEVLQDLLAEGLALVDDGPPHTSSERLFWFPCLSTQSASL
ncbi:vacuolar protein sorting-associated protein [Haematococcus lacustris]|uniref:Vacuolar protein sorting-associated protein n=1 Tax=Haematococcus lacustris TaxID=44745 RepID=A0A699YQ87_HAELA|nr:vacuolar protein sorting-associated protein [Haematococcus lacustris]